MTDRLTEDDLRLALLTLAPADLDATDFRARLDALIADDAEIVDIGSAVPDQAEVHAADVLPLTTSTTAARRRRSRLALYATVAACAAAIVAVAIAVLPERGPEDRGRPTSGTSLPSAFRGMVLPGTIVLGLYRGSGSRDVPIPAHTVPRYFEYGAFATCSGGGDLQVLDEGELSGCNGSTTFGTSAPAGTATMRITAGATTSWTVALVIQPQARTNGSLQSPPGDAPGPDNGLRQNGRGSRTVTFAGDTGASGAPATHYAVRLTCSGTGVQLPEVDGQATNGGPTTTGGLTTRTCFPGHEYTWQSVPLRLPGVVRVVASAGTTWTIFLDPVA